MEIITVRFSGEGNGIDLDEIYIYIYFCDYQLASNHKREKIKALIVFIDMCYLIDCFDGPRTVVRIL